MTMVRKLAGGVFAADREYRQRSVELLPVEAGEGIAILPSNLQQRGTSELAFCPLRPPGASIEAGAGLVAARQGPIQTVFLELAREARRRITAR